MNKSFIILPLVIIVILTNSQPVPRVAKDGSQTFSTIPDWFCNFNFSYNDQVKYTESLNPIAPNTQRDALDVVNDNMIDTITWNGTSCYCWVLLYEDILFDDNRLGLWAGATSGSFDLTQYLVETPDEIIDVTRNEWRQWDMTVSSYRIYCF